MSDAVLTAMIGVAGSIVGAAATVLVARIQTAQKVAREDLLVKAESGKGETRLVLGEAIDIRELRILRALFGEPTGRILESYKSATYSSSLKSVIRKEWVKQIDGRYHLTDKGGGVCRQYVRELLDGWKP